METATIPLKLLKKMERVLDRLDKAPEPIEWVNEDEACKLLGIKKATMIKKVSLREIPQGYYSTGINGVRFYNKQKLMGLA